MEKTKEKKETQKYKCDKKDIHKQINKNIMNSTQQQNQQHIAIVGCVHGNYTQMYTTIQQYEQETRKKISFVLCTGDMQTIRNNEDLKYLKVPPKYKQMGDFHEYYEGKKKAPYLTIFIGGNHEASNVLHHMFYGGYICENMYYLGNCGCIHLNSLTIVGISGIFNEHDEFKTFHYPANEQDMYSLFHTRSYVSEMINKLGNTEGIDIVLSHDWPQGIVMNGNYRQLYKIQPHLKKDGEFLGSPIHKNILNQTYPHYWIASHLHCSYECLSNNTQFYALGKIGYKNAISYLSLDSSIHQRNNEINQSQMNINNNIIYFSKEWALILVYCFPLFSNLNAFPLKYFGQEFEKLMKERTDEKDKQIITLWDQFIGFEMKQRNIPIENHFMLYHDSIKKIYQSIFPSSSNQINGNQMNQQQTPQQVQYQSNQLRTSENDVFLELID